MRSISLWLHFHSEFEHILICLLIISVNCLLFCPFLNWIVFFLLIFRYSLSILEANPLRAISYICWKYLLPFRSMCVPLLILSFSMPYFLSFHVVNFTSLFFVVYAFVSNLRNLSLPWRSQRCFLYFLPKVWKFCFFHIPESYVDILQIKLFLVCVFFICYSVQIVGAWSQNLQSVISKGYILQY